MKIDDSNIKKTIKYLNNDECVAIPTETVYGLAANAYSKKAVSKILIDWRTFGPASITPKYQISIHRSNGMFRIPSTYALEIKEIIRFEDRRSMPITKPRMVASTMPTTASKSVLKMPTISTSLWVLVFKSKPVRFMPSVVGMKPAMSFIKSKPGFMLRRSRFADVLSNKK